MVPGSPGEAAGPCAEAARISAPSAHGAKPDSTVKPTRACAQSSAEASPNATSNTGLRTDGAEEDPAPNSAPAACDSSAPIALGFLHVLRIVDLPGFRDSVVRSVLEYPRNGVGR